MKSPSNTTIFLISLFALAIFFTGSVVAYAGTESFCDTLDQTRMTIEQKKSERVDALRDVQAKHEARFGESKKNFAMLAVAYQTRKVSPAFSENTKRTEIEKTQAMQERLDRAQSFFDQERAGMNTVLGRVSELEKEAFAEAKDACDSGVPSEEVAQTFKEDMTEIQSVVRTHVTTMKKNKDAIGPLHEQAPRAGIRSKLFFFNSQRAGN